MRRTAEKQGEGRREKRRQRNMKEGANGGKNREEQKSNM